MIQGIKNIFYLWIKTGYTSIYHSETGAVCRRTRDKEQCLLALHKYTFIREESI